MRIRMDRRLFLKAMAGLGGVVWLSARGVGSGAPINPSTGRAAVRGIKRSTTQIAFVKTQDRAAGVNTALDLLGINPVEGKNLFVKPNLNSAHAAPGSTHADTLSALIQRLLDMGADGITVGDRSGMGNTRRVMESKDIFRMADELDFKTIVLDELADDDWELMQLPDSYWTNGFPVARPVLEADGIVQTCCLKTHQYGGHFTLSLKNSVGIVAKYVPGEGYNYMDELHRGGHQRQKIAEINATYEPDLVVLDGVEAFVSGGPHEGQRVNAQVILAGTDRVALDAVGVALLRYFGTTSAVSQGPIFAQEQIARAIELDLGVDGPDKIEFVTSDDASAAYAEAIRAILSQG
jgi:uncharacterized protein (DUF362 family)